MTEPVVQPVVPVVPAAVSAAAPGAPAAAAPTPAPAAPGAVPTMPEGLPPALWDTTTNTVKVDDLTKQFIEQSKTAAARAAAVPEKPDGYKLELPAEFKAPEGFKVTFDEKDPRVAQLRTLAHANQWDQKTVSGILAIEAQREIDAQNAESARITAEMAKLGEKFPARRDALTAFINANLSKEHAAALEPFATSAAAFEALEKLVAKATSTAIPGLVPNTPQTPAEIPMKDRWYGGSQQKVS